MSNGVARLREVVIDCVAGDVEAAVAFWSALLGVAVSNRERDWIDLEPDRPGGVHVSFQIVPESKSIKNRLHLDVTVDEIARATRSAAQLGARLVGDVVRETNSDYQVMLDPAGNEFCLVADR